MKKKILVTGSEGFIGSHLIEYLVKKNYSVKAFVLYNSFNNRGWLDSIDKSLLSEIEIFFGDIRNSDSTDLAVKNCNSILHLASLIGIPYSYDTPESYLDTNIRGTMNILQSALKAKIDNFIHTSTSEVYGNADKFPIKESHSLNGQSPYSASKISADQLAYSFYCSFGLPVKIIRPFNTYGPRQSLRAIIPTIITQILNSEKKNVSIKLGALHPRRDLTYVIDTVRAFELMLRSEKINGEVLNIGSGFEINMRELSILIADICEKKVNFIKDKKRVRPNFSEVNRLLCDNRKAKKLINWEPHYKKLSGLKTGLIKTVDWIKKNPNYINKNSQYIK